MKLKYGENPHQDADVKFEDGGDLLAIGSFLVNGRPLREMIEAPFGEVLLDDLDRATETITRIAAVNARNWRTVPDIALVVKHGNPCGAAIDSTRGGNHVWKAFRGHRLDAFGGLLMLSTPFTSDVLDDLLAQGNREGLPPIRPVLSAVAAPSIDDAAKRRLQRSAREVFFFENPALVSLGERSIRDTPVERGLRGGKIIRSPNRFVPIMEKLIIAGGDPGDPAKWYGDIALAWAVGSTSVSNTITLASDAMVIGNGCGQQGRVGAARLAITRAGEAGHVTQGAVAYSDSFFPFCDGVEVLARSGIKVIFATTGSVQDEQVIARARQLGVTLFLVPDKEGRGFYGH